MNDVNEKHDHKQTSNELDVNDDTITANKHKLKQQNKRKRAIYTTATIGVSLIFLGIVLFQIRMHTYKAEITYEKAADSLAFEEESTYWTAKNGDYVIGQSPSEYVSGNEQEFQTDMSGTYVAGEDFPVGTYDIMSIDTTGNISTSKEGKMLYNNVNAGSNDGFNVQLYDNYTFTKGEELKVSGIMATLMPQQNDTMVIEPREYDITATNGTGYVTITDASNNISLSMGTISSIDGGIKTQENFTFSDGQVLNVSGVSIMLSAQLAKKTVTETVEFDTSKDNIICKINAKVVGCYSLQYYGKLMNDIETQMDKEWIKYP